MSADYLVDFKICTFFKGVSVDMTEDAGGRRCISFKLFNNKNLASEQKAYRPFIL